MSHSIPRFNLSCNFFMYIRTLGQRPPRWHHDETVVILVSLATFNLNARDADRARDFTQPSATDVGVERLVSIAATRTREFLNAARPPSPPSPRSTRATANDAREGGPSRESVRVHRRVRSKTTEETSTRSIRHRAKDERQGQGEIALQQRETNPKGVSGDFSRTAHELQRGTEGR